MKCFWVEYGWFEGQRKLSSIVRSDAGSRGEPAGSLWSSLTRQGGTAPKCLQALPPRLSCCHGDWVAREEMAIYTLQSTERHPSEGRLSARFLLSSSWVWAFSETRFLKQTALFKVGIRTKKSSSHNNLITSRVALMYKKLISLWYFISQVAI